MKKILVPFVVTSAIFLLIFLLFANVEDFFTELLKGSVEQKLWYCFSSFVALTSDILLPVPSSIVMYTNGFILGFFQGMVLSLVSVIIGAYIGYYLGRFTSYGLKAKRDQKTDIFLSKYGSTAILVSRGIPILSESVSIVCGYNKMNLKNYLLFNVIGYIPVCLLYAFFGSIGYDKDLFLLTFGCSLCIAALFLFTGKKYLKAI